MRSIAIPPAECRASVEARFSLDRMADDYERIYERAIVDAQSDVKLGA
jgi:hypothetical protein